MRLFQLPACLILCLAGACESGAKKLERLKGDAAIATLIEQHAQRGADSIAMTSAPEPIVRAYKDSLRQSVIAHDLAQRDLDKFMQGH